VDPAHGLPAHPPFVLRARLLTPVAGGGLRYEPDARIEVDERGRLRAVGAWADGADASAALEEQLSFWRRGRDDDVTAFLGFSAEVAIQNPVDRVHRLGTAAERDDARIRFRGVVASGQDHLVLHGHASHSR